MANQEVKLLGSRSSPFVRRVEWALKLKDIEYEYLEEEDIIHYKSPLLLESNPVHKRVPVLIHGGKAICESLNIIEYIDETWSQYPLFPEDPYERAMVRFWAKFAEEKLAECLRNVLRTEGEEQEKVMKQFEEALEIIEGEAKGKKKFFGGETIGFLDIVLGWTILWLEVLEVTCEKKIFSPHKFPCFAKWMEEFKDIPLIKENLPSKDLIHVYFVNIRKVIFGAKANK